MPTGKRTMTPLAAVAGGSLTGVVGTASWLWAKFR